MSLSSFGIRNGDMRESMTVKTHQQTKQTSMIGV